MAFQAAAGLPFNACEFQSKGDALADITENLAAEQKARVVYDNLLRMIPDPEVREPLKFLRTREIVHFQRFGEAMEQIKARLDSKTFIILIRSLTASLNEGIIGTPSLGNLVFLWYYP